MKGVWLIAALLWSSCSLRTQPEDTEPGVVVEVVTPAGEDYRDLVAAIDGSQSWSPDDFLAAHAVAFEPQPMHEPMEAEFLDLIADSSLALDADELARLAADGFVVTSHRFPSFVYGLQTIYMEDLPLFVSADSILFAVHRSYDEMLATIERDYLVADLAALIDAMRSRLRAGDALGFTADQETDVDILLAVAGTLLNDVPRPVLVGASQDTVNALVRKAVEADGTEERALFGAKRFIDWSQFKPRGHYAGDPVLEAYFRARMWLARADFRMLQPEGSKLVLHRRQLYDALAMANLLDDASRQSFARLHDTIGLFVGEQDSMIVTDVPSLLEALGVDDRVGVKALSDAAIAAAIQKHQFGAQRIASQLMVNGIAGTTLPLAHSLSLLGQRYVVDSHVFTNVVYDRAGGGSIPRMMPNPLDVAFAAMGNDQAGLLLESELRTFEYQHDLESMRVLVDAHDDAFWTANLYNHWMRALRTLSPGTDAAGPSTTRTESWGRRLLTTQLASWAELRHDTLLYAKPSYTTGAVCEYPDAFVEPNPAFFEAIAALAADGRTATGAFSDPRFIDYFDRLEAAARRLERMSVAQQSGEPHSEDDLAWVNEAVAIEENCDGTPLGATGWYGDLFFARREVDFDPTIADVHTQPTDAGGTTVGRVLHVGTGMAHGIVATFDTCVGPRAYVGLTSSYYEVVTQDFERLDDSTWAPAVMAEQTVPPEWAP